MLNLLPNKHGYLLLSQAEPSFLGGYCLVKADKITAIEQQDGESLITLTSRGDDLLVMEKIDEILEQLENIHPSLR